MSKTAAERKRDSRAARAQHLKDVGASEIKFTVYRSTREKLNFINKHVEVQDDCDTLTRIIHAVYDLIKRDMSHEQQLIKDIGE